MENKSNAPPPPPPPPPPTSSTAPPPPPPQETTLGPRRRQTGVKRKTNNYSSSSSKRSRGRTFTPLPHIQQYHNGPITRARQSPNKAAAAAAAASAAAAAAATSSSSFTAPTSVHDKPIEPLLQPTPPIGGGGGGGEVAISVSQELNLIETADRNTPPPLESAIDAEFDAIRSRETSVHVVPTPSAWFSWTKIHPLEERTLASFFNGKSESRTPEIYMEIRNWIMKKFHKNPKTQIESKDLGELSVGELNARQEVMEFLDHWGLINFHPFPVADADGTKDEMKMDGLSRTAMLVDKLYRFEVAVLGPRDGPKVDLAAQAIVPRLVPESAVAEEVRPEGPAVEYHCNSCSADCSRKRYHCQKQADFDLCSECYNNGKFDSGMSPADFILMEPAEVPGVCGGSWTDQETLLLLEALELFGENWTEIAEHVATKSKAQCILHFVQMPIEDTFLEGKDDFDASLHGNNGPGSTCDDSSAFKESNEMVESRSGNDTDLSALNASHETKESNSTNNGSSTLNKTPDTTESKSAAEERPLSPNVDAADSGDSVEVKAAQDITNFAIDALKEAFQVVGSGESISFADAGNPVMALVAFLSGLVAPDIAAASARSSIKATSEEAPSIQLTSMHCYILEDPSEDLKEPHGSESADVEMLDGEAQKDDVKAQNEDGQKEFQVQNDVSVNAQKDKDEKEDGQKEKFQVQNDMSVDVQKDKNQKQGGQKEKFQVQNDVSVDAQKDKDHKQDGSQVSNHMAVLDSSDVSKDCTNKKIELVSLPDEGKENCATKELDDATNKEDVTPVSVNELSDSALPGQDQLSPQDVGKETCAAKEPVDGVNKEDVAPSTTKDSDDSGLPEKDLPSTVNRLGNLAIPLEIAPISAEESTSVAPPGEVSQFPEVPKDVDMESGLVPPEGKNPQETVAPSSSIEARADTGECGLKIVESKCEKTCNLSEAKDDHNIEKVKRAALAALSAAAVKSKLLADQEEDRIRQLAAFLIEKQLHKIETKLAFFGDMENVILRAKDQMDRSRQRLYHERAQIIAARLGMPASTNRAVPPSLANNRVAMSYANSMPKSMPNMNPQKMPGSTHSSR